MRAKLRVKISYDKIIWVLTIILLAGFIILEKYSWGKYLFLLVSGFIFVIDNLSHKGSYIPSGPFQIKFGLFITYCFLTSLWALSSSNAIEFSITLVLIFVCLSMIAPHYMRDLDISKLLSATMWASIIVAIYTIQYYGVSTLIASSQTQDVRLGNDYSNINTIGMFCAFGVVIQFEKWLYNKKIQLSMPFMFISIFVVACTQSRKAFLLMVIGCMIVVVMKNYDKINIIQSIFKIIGILVIIGILMSVISHISIFSGVQERLGQFFSLFTGNGDLDSGIVNRQEMVQIGFQSWKENPIFGVGLNCTRIILKQIMGIDSYMHNNYIELLCATGVVGFGLYYSMHIYILRSLLKYRRYNRRYFVFGIMWLIITLVMDVGFVSYYGKTQCFYLMVQFLNIAKLKKQMNKSIDVRKYNEGIKNN